MTNTGLWGTLIKSKYMSRLSLDIWLRRSIFNLNLASIVWCSLLTTFPYIFPNLCWLAGRGNLIYIGLDPIVGMPNFTLSNPLLAWLHSRHLLLLKQVFIHIDSLAPRWLSSTDIDLTGEMGYVHCSIICNRYLSTRDSG